MFFLLIYLLAGVFITAWIMMSKSFRSYLRSTHRANRWFIIVAVLCLMAFIYPGFLLGVALNREQA